MIAQASMALVVGLLVVAAGPRPDPSEDLEKFQGTWWTVSMVVDGRKVSAETLKERRVVVRDNKYVVFDGDDVIQHGTFKLDPSTMPRQIDTTPATGPNAGKTDKGIYELKDGVIQFCYAPPGEARPEKFSAEEGSGRWLVTDHRKKPENGGSEKP